MISFWKHFQSFIKGVDLNYLNAFRVVEIWKLSLIKSCSPRLLKQSIGSAQIYIRPIQADLDISPLSGDEVEEVSMYVLYLIEVRMYTYIIH